MEPILLAGIKKKSFELNYNGGTIWCEHLDSMGDCETLVIDKFTEDSKTFLRSSVSAFMIINLQLTVLTAAITEILISILTGSAKAFRKIAIVGVDRHCRKALNPIGSKGSVLRYFDDYEKAKEWMF